MEEISPLAACVIIFASIASFFGTIDTLWLKSYKWGLTNLDTTTFGWITFFAAVSAIFSTGAIGLICWWLIKNSRGFFSYSIKIALGIWRIVITVTVVYLVAKEYGFSFIH